MTASISQLRRHGELSNLQEALIKNCLLYTTCGIGPGKKMKSVYMPVYVSTYRMVCSHVMAKSCRLVYFDLLFISFSTMTIKNFIVWNILRTYLQQRHRRRAVASPLRRGTGSQNSSISAVGFLFFGILMLVLGLSSSESSRTTTSLSIPFSSVVSSN